MTTLISISSSGTHEPSSYYLNQLRPLLSSADPELCNEFYTLEIEHHLSRKDYPNAMDKVASHLASSRSTSASDKQHDNSDLAHRLHYLIQKARIFALAGRASKGFSLSLRATATAERHLLVPVMLEGLCVLGRILIEVSEFAAARRLYEASLPLALEGGDAVLVARMWVALGESCVGSAGRCQDGRTASDGMAMIGERLERSHDGDINEGEPSASAATAIKNEQKRLMRRADECIERGREAFEQLQAVDSQMECLIMKSRIAEWSGDETARTLAGEMFDGLARMKREWDETVSRS